MIKNEQKEYQYMTRRIGSTTYKVKVAFAESASETLEEKILRMIRNEGSANGSECGIIDVPQMSRVGRDYLKTGFYTEVYNRILLD